MKTISEIISHCDHVLKTIPGSVILSDEEWQTLKSAVLSQPADNISVMPCLQEQCVNFPNCCSECRHLERPSLSEARA